MCGACLTPHRRRRGLLLLLQERPPLAYVRVVAGGHLFLDVPSGRRVHHHTISLRLCHRSTFAMGLCARVVYTERNVVQKRRTTHFKRFSRNNRIFHQTRTESIPFGGACCSRPFEITFVIFNKVRHTRRLFRHRTAHSIFGLCPNELFYRTLRRLLCDVDIVSSGPVYGQ